MPVILEDDMLIPPSMRRKRYYGVDSETIITSPGSTTTIELPLHRPMTPPRERGPLIIHEDHYVPVYEDVTREYYISPTGDSSRYRRGGELRGAQYVRARSVGPADYDSNESSFSDDYYLEDGIRYGGRRHRHRSPGRYGHNRRGAHRSQSHHRSSSHHRSYSHGAEHPHRARHLAEAGLAVAGLNHAANHHRQRSHSRGRRGSEGAVYGEHHPGWHDDNHRDHRRALHLAEAGLGIAAVGAAKEIYDHRKRAQHRRSSSASSTSSTNATNGHESHKGRHVAAAALGATAAGLAYHKMHHHSTHRSSSVSSCSSDEEHRSHHRGRKIAGVAIGAAAAGMTGKALHDHYRHSRSRSLSSSDGERRQHHSKLPAAALGTAAVLAAKHHYDHKHDGRSRSRSADHHHHLPGPLEKAGYMMTGALVEKHHRKKHYEREHHRSLSADGHREHRHRRSSESSGNHANDSHHRSRRGSTAGGLGGLVNNIMGGTRSGGREPTPPPHMGIGERVAYKLGEAVADEISGRRAAGRR